MSEGGAETIRVLVLDDGDTWEVLAEDSRALVVEVTVAELARLEEGERVDEVLADRKGTRVAWLARGRPVVVEFFEVTADVIVPVGPFDWVHLEGRSLVGVTGEERALLAELVPGTGRWRDGSGVEWIDVAVRPDPART